MHIITFEFVNDGAKQACILIQGRVRVTRTVAKEAS